MSEVTRLLDAAAAGDRVAAADLLPLVYDELRRGRTPLNPVTDPAGTGTSRVYRGGQWFSQLDGGHGRSSARHFTPPRPPDGLTGADLPVLYAGSRVVVELPPVPPDGPGKELD